MAAGKRARWMVQENFYEALKQYAKFEIAPPKVEVEINGKKLSGGLGLV